MHEWENRRRGLFTLGHDVEGEYVPEVPEYAVDDGSSEHELPHDTSACKKTPRERSRSTADPKMFVYYFRRPSHPAPPLAEAMNTHTAIQGTSPFSLVANATSMHRHHDHDSNFIKRAYTGIHDMLEDYEVRDAKEGAQFEYRLARTRNGLPENVQEAEDIRDSHFSDIETPLTPCSKRRGSTTCPDPDPPEKEGAADPFLVTFESTNSVHDNPRTWSYPQRVATLAMYAFFSLLGPYASSMVSPAAKVIGEKMDVHSKLVQNMFVGLFMLAFVAGPLCSAPISEAYGRRIVVFTGTVFFIIFNIGCAVTNKLREMLVLRFITGFFGSAILPMGGGAVSDLFELHERGTAMALYTAAPVLGPTIGPLISGWIVQGWGEDRWRWVFWVGTILAGLVFMCGIVFARETYAPFILYLKARRLRKETGDKQYRTVFEKKSETAWQKVKRILLRPVIFLFTEPLVFLPSLYMSIIYACFYLCIASLPRVYTEKYQERIGIAALHNLALAIGLICIGQLGGWFIDYTYKKLSAKHGCRRPEFKLPLMMITVFVLPAGMLLFGWTAQYETHWIAPDIGLVVIGGGVIGSMLLTQMYLADLMTIYASSAISAVASMRSLFAFLFLLFSNAMLDRLDVGWTLSVLALIVAVVGIPSPFLLYRYGPALRARSNYCVKG